METNIVKREMFKCHASTDTYNNGDQNVIITVNDAGERVKLLIEAVGSSTIVTFTPEDARTLANMLYSVAGEVKDEYADLLKKKVKPLTKAKKQPILAMEVAMLKTDSETTKTQTEASV